MSEKFDEQYIKAHRQKVHNYDSIARTLIENVLRSAESQLKANPKLSAPITVPVEFHVSSIPAPAAAAAAHNVQPHLLCVDVTATIAGVTVVTGHVGL
jgi:hypothetical protein